MAQEAALPELPSDLGRIAEKLVEDPTAGTQVGVAVGIRGVDWVASGLGKGRKDPTAGTQVGAEGSRGVRWAGCGAGWGGWMEK